MGLKHGSLLCDYTKAIWFYYFYFCYVLSHKCVSELNYCIDGHVFINSGEITCRF
jgi:hypothetical protein